MPKAISMPELHSAQTVHQSFAETNTILKRTKTSFHSTYNTYEYHSGVPKVISTHVVHSVQTVHLSCDEINTISKQIETSFLLTTVS